MTNKGYPFKQNMENETDFTKRLLSPASFIVTLSAVGMGRFAASSSPRNLQTRSLTGSPCKILKTI